MRIAAPNVLDELIAQLECTGCQPREIAPGRWLALCPDCRASIAEVRAVDGAPPLVACVDACERRLAA